MNRETLWKIFVAIMGLLFISSLLIPLIANPAWFEDWGDEYYEQGNLSRRNNSPWTRSILARNAIATRLSHLKTLRKIGTMNREPVWKVLWAIVGLLFILSLFTPLIPKVYRLLPFIPTPV